jgi:hypothetical protein
MIGDRSEAVGVGLLAHQLTGERFRGDVLQGPDEESGAGQPLCRVVLGVARNPEIESRAVWVSGSYMMFAG